MDILEIHQICIDADDDTDVAMTCKGRGARIINDMAVTYQEEDPAEVICQSLADLMHAADLVDVNFAKTIVEATNRYVRDCHDLNQ